jgi:phosphatidylglycerophosphate synthase
MDLIPDRPHLASPYRALLSFLEARLVLPDINPAYYSVLGILLSVVFLYLQTTLGKIIVIGVVLLADWLDGATVRRYGQVRRSGYITDAAVDRLSEALIFSGEVTTIPGQIFFLLWIVNSLLTFYSVTSNQHVSLPLRFLYIIALILYPQ